MPVRIIYRSIAATNSFREMILNVISCDKGDEIILCSGFFQEGNGGFFASREGRFLQRLRASRKRVVTVGVHNAQWYPQYRSFVNTLRNAGIQIEGRLFRHFHWHAKIFLLLKNKRPIFGIVGSSNITRNAFSLSEPFNIEADVVLWCQNYPKLTTVVNRALADIKQQDYSVLQYRSSNNHGITVSDRLQHLYDMVIKKNDGKSMRLL